MGIIRETLSGRLPPDRYVLTIPWELRKHLGGVSGEEIQEAMKSAVMGIVRGSPTYGKPEKWRLYNQQFHRVKKKRRVDRGEARRKSWELSLENLTWTFDLHGKTGVVGCSGLDGTEAGYVNERGVFEPCSRYCEREVAYGFRAFLVSDAAEHVSWWNVQKRWGVLADRWGFGVLFEEAVRASAGEHYRGEEEGACR